MVRSVLKGKKRVKERSERSRKARTGGTKDGEGEDELGIGSDEMRRSEILETIGEEVGIWAKRKKEKRSRVSSALVQTRTRLEPSQPRRLLCLSSSH